MTNHASWIIIVNQISRYELLTKVDTNEAKDMIMYIRFPFCPYNRRNMSREEEIGNRKIDRDSNDLRNSITEIT